MIPFFEPVSFPIGPITIHLFGIFVATGILVGARWTQIRGAQLGLPKDDVSSMITSTLVVGFIVAHLFDVIAYMPRERWTFTTFINPFEGISSYGGFMGALMGLFGWCRWHKRPVMPYADSLGYGLSIGWMFGRLGCFSAHDHIGRLTDSWLAITFPENHPRFPSGRRFDLGLDEALWAAGVALTFYILARKRRPLGIYVALLTTFYGPFRFFLDGLRAVDIREPDARYFGYTPAQYGAAATTLVGIGLLVWVWQNARRTKALASSGGVG